MGWWPCGCINECQDIYNCCDGAGPTQLTLTIPSPSSVDNIGAGISMENLAGTYVLSCPEDSPSNLSDFSNADTGPFWWWRGPDPCGGNGTLTIKYSTKDFISPSSVPYRMWFILENPSYPTYGSRAFDGATGLDSRIDFQSGHASTTYDDSASGDQCPYSYCYDSPTPPVTCDGTADCTDSWNLARSLTPSGALIWYDDNSSTVIGRFYWPNPLVFSLVPG